MDLQKLNYTELYSLRAEYIGLMEYWSEGHHDNFREFSQEFNVPYISETYIRKLIDNAISCIEAIEDEINERDND